VLTGKTKLAVDLSQATLKGTRDEHRDAEGLKLIEDQTRSTERLLFVKPHASSSEGMLSSEPEYFWPWDRGSDVLQGVSPAWCCVDEHPDTRPFSEPCNIDDL